MQRPWGSGRKHLLSLGVEHSHLQLSLPPSSWASVHPPSPTGCPVGPCHGPSEGSSPRPAAGGCCGPGAAPLHPGQSSVRSWELTPNSLPSQGQCHSMTSWAWCGKPWSAPSRDVPSGSSQARVGDSWFHSNCTAQPTFDGQAILPRMTFALVAA